MFPVKCKRWEVITWMEAKPEEKPWKKTTTTKKSRYVNSGYGTPRYPLDTHVVVKTNPIYENVVPKKIRNVNSVSYK